MRGDLGQDKEKEGKIMSFYTIWSQVAAEKNQWDSSLVIGLLARDFLC